METSDASTSDKADDLTRRSKEAESLLNLSESSPVRRAIEHKEEGVTPLFDTKEGFMVAMISMRTLLHVAIELDDMEFFRKAIELHPEYIQRSFGGRGNPLHVVRDNSDRS